jgi:hypothetical protein
MFSVKYCLSNILQQFVQVIAAPASFAEPEPASCHCFPSSFFGNRTHLPVFLLPVFVCTQALLAALGKPLRRHGSPNFPLKGSTLTALQYRIQEHPFKNVERRNR